MQCRPTGSGCAVLQAAAHAPVLLCLLLLEARTGSHLALSFQSTPRLCRRRQVSDIPAASGANPGDYRCVLRWRAGGPAQLFRLLPLEQVGHWLALQNSTTAAADSRSCPAPLIPACLDAVVVTPLLSLMQDQVQALNSLASGGVPTTYISSQQTETEARVGGRFLFGGSQAPSAPTSPRRRRRRRWVGEQASGCTGLRVVCRPSRRLATAPPKL